MEKCNLCQVKLEKNDIGLCKKLLSKKTKEFFCQKHLAQILNVSTEDLDEKLEEFIEEGCTLFL